MAKPYKLDIAPQEYHPLQTPPPVGEERFELLPSEVNDIVAKHNALQQASNPLWVQDYSGLRCWFPDVDGVPINYYAHPGATESQLGATDPISNPHWIQFGGSRPYERWFGDAINKTFTLAHSKTHVRDVVIIDTASNQPVAVGVDWLSNPGHVIIGPFASVPTANRYKLIVEGNS